MVMEGDDWLSIMRLIHYGHVLSILLLYSLVMVGAMGVRVPGSGG